MATLPDTYGRRPTPQDRSSFVAAPEVSQTARAMAQLAGQVGDIGENYQKQQDAAAVSAARRALDDWERSAIFDPEKGAINKRGQDAFGVSQELQKGFDAEAGRVMGGLNAGQRRLFQQVADGRRAQVLDWAGKHTLRERESFEEGQYQADVKSFVDRAALMPDKANAELALLQQRTIGYLRGKGRSTEEINATLRENMDKAHIGVVSSLLNADDEDGASKYFAANKAGMSADVAARIGQEVKARGALLKAQTNADEMVSKGLTQAEAIAQTRAKFDGKNEEDAVQQLKTRFAEAEAARITEVREVTTSAWSKLMERGSMSAIPAQTMAALRTMAPEEERQMRDWLQAKAERAKADAEGKPPKTDWPTYLRLRDYAAKNPDAFAKEDLQKYVPYMAGAQLEQLQDMKEKIANPTGRTEVQTTAQQIGTVVDQLGLGGTKNAEKRGLFEAAVYDELARAQSEKGKGRPLTYDERQTIIDRQTMTVAVPGRVFGTSEKPAYEVRGTPEAAAARIVVPDNDRALIRQSLERRGLPVSDAEVMRLYKAKLGIQ